MIIPYQNCHNLDPAKILWMNVCITMHDVPARKIFTQNLRLQLAFTSEKVLPYRSVTLFEHYVGTFKLCCVSKMWLTIKPQTLQIMVKLSSNISSDNTM